jgi:predicted phosphodiesterase
MRYAVLSDIHGNLEALEAVIRSCREEGVRGYFCAGDIVGYGADPSACIERLKDLKAVCIAGNHDWAVLDKINLRRFNAMATAAITWTKTVLGPSELGWLDALELEARHDSFTVVHGSLNEPSQFHYISDLADCADTFYLMKTPVCFVGHTHVPGVFGQKGGLSGYMDEEHVEFDEKIKYIVNVGSVGQPRDGDPRAAFGIYDPDLKRVQVKRVSYDIQRAQVKIIRAGLPSELAQRLSFGK